MWSERPIAVFYPCLHSQRFGLLALLVIQNVYVRSRNVRLGPRPVGHLFYIYGIVVYFPVAVR